MEGESVGIVASWSEEEGWGVIESEETPGGCWAHFTHVLAGGDEYRALTVGQVAPFAYEAAEQDGYAFRAVWVASLAPDELRRPDPEAAAGIAGPSPAYTSALTITHDDHEHGDRGSEPLS